MKILVTIIAIVEVIRLLMILPRGRRKKLAFKKKEQGLIQVSWDLEFALFKLREAREETRHQRDQQLTRLEALENDIIKRCVKAGAKEDDVKEVLAHVRKDQDGNVYWETDDQTHAKKIQALIGEHDDLYEIKRLIDNWFLQKRDVHRKENEIAAIDREINGIPPSPDLPDGAPGIIERLDDIHESRKLLRDYVKTV